MKRSWWVSGALLVCLAAALPAEAQRYRHERYGDQQSFRLRLGLFTPEGDSDFFDQTEFDFTGDAQEFEDAVAGVDYVYEMNRTSAS